MTIVKRQQRNFEIDSDRFPAVVIESDDWGCCECIPTRNAIKPYQEIIARLGNEQRLSCGLETVSEMEMLFNVLRSFSGIDGIFPVFTAYTGVGNPDFDAIRASGFTRYIDIGLDQGFPTGWNGDGIVEKMCEGMRIGVWEPEYHSMLHHTSPRIWLERLNSSGTEGELARALFELKCYEQCMHIPEYEKYNVREQFEFIDIGFRRFEKTFGRLPQAAVTSDAYPETELLWAARGVRTIALKNCRVNSGEVVVYATKPWNNQDVYAHIGDYNPVLDVTYLTRNVFMEFSTPLEEALNAAERTLKKHKEPIVLSTHRCNYCTFDESLSEDRRAKLCAFLNAMVKRGVYFLTSGELGDLYRQGWSMRKLGGKMLFRKWSQCALRDDFIEAYELPSMKRVKIGENSIGNYLIGM